MVSVRYGRFFIGGVPGGGTPAGLGAYLYEDSHFKLGATLSADIIQPRKESYDSRHLRGLGDINGTVRGGAFASYTLGWFTLHGNALYDLEDHHNHEGLLASLEATARYSPLPRLTLTAGPGVTFGNQRYMQTFFGIDALQAQRSSYAQYTPKGGVALVGFSVGAGYELTSHWSVGAHVAAERLQGDAGRSPIVENKNQNVYAMFAFYRF
jgi:outer membrane protein